LRLWTGPCINPNRTYAKNHDFGLLNQNVSDENGLRASPIIPTERYFIQYRNPVAAIASDFKLYIRREPNRDRRAVWQDFALRQVSYWNRFVDKWVLNFPSDAVPPLYCSYEALIADPQERVREILAFLSDNPLDEERLKTIMQKVPIVPRNSLSRFKFNDPIFFKELESAASPRLDILGLPFFEETLNNPGQAY